MPRLNFSARSNGYYNKNNRWLKSQGLATWIKSPQYSYLLIRLILCFSEESDVLDESGLDVLIVHELAEYVKLLPQELVGKINLMAQTNKRGQI